MKVTTLSDDISTTNGNHYLSDNQTLEDIERKDNFEILIANNGITSCFVQLSKTVLSYRYRDKLKDKTKNVFVVDIIGCAVKEWEQSHKVLLNVIAYEVRRSQRVKREIKLLFCKHPIREQNYEEAFDWKKSILSLNYGKIFNNNISVKSKPLLFIVNPKSGRGRALKIFEQTVKPLLKESETDFETHITKHANHALEVMRDMEDITRFRAVVVVSGDGLLYEVVNGLTKRSDTLTDVKVPIALGIIPGGSGNGLAHAVNQAFLNRVKSVDPIFDCTLHVIQGRPIPMDLVRVTTPANTYYAFLSVGWGLMADIDIESERLRMIGEPRFTLWALYRSFALRKNRAVLSYLPAESTPSAAPPLDSPVPSDWVTIDDTFVQIYSAFQTHISSTAIFAPNATFDDGLIWLVFIRGDVSRKQVIQFLLALEKGKHPALPFVQMVPVRAFRIVPNGNVGKVTVDGELIESGPVQAEVVPRMASVLSR